MITLSEEEKKAKKKERDRERGRERRRKRRESGLCTECGRKQDREGRIRCKRCYKLDKKCIRKNRKIKIWSKCSLGILQKERREQGVCIGCGSTRSPRSIVRCDDCLAKRRKKRRIWDRRNRAERKKKARILARKKKKNADFIGDNQTKTTCQDHKWFEWDGRQICSICFTETMYRTQRSQRAWWRV